MKYYDSTFEEYVSSVEKYNLHEELVPVFSKFPHSIQEIENMIIYGSAGIGKYSQVLYLLKKYSPSELKYEKKIVANTEKQSYIYHISDIHYEIDMSLLGCNSKILWHEIFFQIVDIVAVKPNKCGIILCKNFHLIHSELLEIFYSYMQQYNHSQTNIRIKFFILTEHIGFIPNTIVNNCHVLRMKRPTMDQYINNAVLCKPEIKFERYDKFVNIVTTQKSSELGKIDAAGTIARKDKYQQIFSKISIEDITNIKEIYSLPQIENVDDVPKDVFNIICDNIIADIISPNKIVFTEFRDKLYEILTYNLDMNECLLYIISFLIENNRSLSEKDISDILVKTYPFLKYFNNNYRPIFHLESIMYYIINKIHKFDGLREGL